MKLINVLIIDMLSFLIMSMNFIDIILYYYVYYLLLLITINGKQLSLLHNIKVQFFVVLKIYVQKHIT